MANLLCYDFTEDINVREFLKKTNLIKKSELYTNSKDQKITAIYNRMISNYNRTDDIVYKDGINILYEKKHEFQQEVADFDIVLIHGLRGNFYTTWRVE